MSGTTEDRISKLLDFPYGAYLMIRLDYIILCQDELEAKIMRIIERYVEDERKALYRKYMNELPKGSVQTEQVIDIAKDVWTAISHRTFLYELYGQVKSENTLKRAIKSLLNKEFIRIRNSSGKQYEAPQYQLNADLINEEFKKIAQLGKSGYQNLIPSMADTINDDPHQPLIPSGYQNLTPEGQLIPSNFDTNRRRDYEKSNREDSFGASLRDDAIHTTENNSHSEEVADAENTLLPVPDVACSSGVHPRGSAAGKNGVAHGGIAAQSKEPEHITQAPASSSVFALQRTSSAIQGQASPLPSVGNNLQGSTTEGSPSVTSIPQNVQNMKSNTEPQPLSPSAQDRTDDGADHKKLETIEDYDEAKKEFRDGLHDAWLTADKETRKKYGKWVVFQTEQLKAWLIAHKRPKLHRHQQRIDEIFNLASTLAKCRLARTNEQSAGAFALAEVEATDEQIMTTIRGLQKDHFWRDHWTLKTVANQLASRVSSSHDPLFLQSHRQTPPPIIVSQGSVNSFNGRSAAYRAKGNAH